MAGCRPAQLTYITVSWEYFPWDFSPCAREYHGFIWGQACDFKSKNIYIGKIFFSFMKKNKTSIYYVTLQSLFIFRICLKKSPLEIVQYNVFINMFLLSFLWSWLQKWSKLITMLFTAVTWKQEKLHQFPTRMTWGFL